MDFSLFTPLSRLQFTSDCFYCGSPRPVVLCKGAHFRSCNTKGEVNPPTTGLWLLIQKRFRTTIEREDKQGKSPGFKTGQSIMQGAR